MKHTICFSPAYARQVRECNGRAEHNKFLLLPAETDHSDKVFGLFSVSAATRYLDRPCVPPDIVQIFVDVPRAFGKERHALVSSDDCMMPPSFPNICENFDGRSIIHFAILNRSHERVTIYTCDIVQAETSTYTGFCEPCWIIS